MKEFFNRNTTNEPQDVKAIRESLLLFIKDQLRKAEGGEGGNIRALQLFITAEEADRHLYEAAVYFDETDRFKNEEVQRIADDFALALPPDWNMEITFTNELPAEAKKIEGVQAGLFIKTTKRSLAKSATAYIRILNGEAEQEQYTITSSQGKINIGREPKVQGSDGFFRINHIAFPANSTNESNKFVSRQHAHIQFDNEAGHFLLFADEGGIPPRNKIKVRSQTDAAPVKLFTTQFGHVLQDGDQIMLGDAALLAFSYQPD